MGIFKLNNQIIIPNEYPNGLKNFIIPYTHTLSFDGIDDYISIGYNFPEIQGDISYTLEAWVYIKNYPPGQTTNGASVIGHASSNGFGIQIEMSGFVNFGARSNNNFSSNTTLNLNKWYHVVGVRNKNDNHYIYINGNQDAVHNTYSDLNVTPTSSEVQIGWAEGRITGSTFDGMIRDVRIWNVGRTQTQIQNSMNSTFNGDEDGLIALYRLNSYSGTTAIDSTLQKHHGLIHGAEWVSV